MSANKSQSFGLCIILIMFFKKIDFLLLLILALAAFFRFYNFLEYQYWSGDEEILTAVIRHIIWDRSPILIIPNSNLGFGLGPFFHYLLTPFYFVTSFNLPIVTALASIIGIATTYLMYLAGKELKDRKLGLIASFLYSSSFLMALFDRRLWPLTLDPFFAIFTVLILSKVIKRNYRLIPLLAMPIGFSFHSDPTLLVLLISILLIWVIYRLPIINKNVLFLLFGIGIFIAPLVLAEIHYNGAVTKPIVQSLARPLRGENVTNFGFNYFNVNTLPKIFSKIIWTAPNNFIEQEFCYCNTPKEPLFPISILISFVVFAVSFLALFRYKSYGFRREVNTILWVILISFFAGLLVYNRLFKGIFNEHYFVVILPILILLLSQTFYLIYLKYRIIFFLFIATYLILNFHTLLNSNVKYPLYKKIALVKSSLNIVGNDKFSLYSSGNPYIHGGGWTELYTLEKHPAVKSYWYDFLGWIYAAYSLYPGPTQKEDPEIIVWILKDNERLPLDLPIISNLIYKDLRLYVLDNSKRVKEPLTN